MKNELISAFEDTREKSLGVLAEQTAVAQKNARIYFENFEHSKSTEDVLRNQQCTIHVVEGSSFSAARKYLPDGKVAVLNFANPENPGGGVQNGAMAQEECLCRSMQ